MERHNQRNKLKKQPKRSRVQSSSPVNHPSLNVPKTARKRRRKQKTKKVRVGLSLMKRFFINSRWISLGLFALAVYALFTIAQERRFYLTYIPVEGAKSITPDKVAQASGLAGNHIFSADPSLAAEQIAEIPGVLSSTVTLRWPNEVLIQITEESPIAVWYEDEIEYGITSSGRLIPGGYPTAGLLKIVRETGSIRATGIISPTEASETEVQNELEETAAEPQPDNSDTNQTGNDQANNVASPTPTPASMAGMQTEEEEGLPASQPFVPQEVLRGALQLRELRPDIEELYYRPYGGLSFEDGRGWRGYFGTGTEMNQKLAIYETIVSDLLSRGIRPAQISVSNQEKPYYLAQ